MNEANGVPDGGPQTPDAGAGTLEDFFSRSGLSFGAADIFLVGRRTYRRTAELIRLLFLGFTGADGSPSVKRCVVVTPPPGTNPVQAKARIVSAIDEAMHDVRGSGLASDETAMLERCIEVAAAADGELPGLRDLVSRAPAKSAVIVLDAARYRAPMVAAYVPAGRPGPGLPEDFWVPHLTETARQLTDVASRGELYVLLDAGEYGPARQELLNLLMSVDRCGVASGQPDGDPMGVSASQIESWVRRLEDGRLGGVLAEIESLPDVNATTKAVLRIDALHRAGLHRMAADAVEHLDPSAPTAPEAVVRLARCAQEGGMPATAKRLLTKVSGRLESREALELALDTASKLDVAAVEVSLAERLRHLFPRSVRLRRWDVDEALKAGRYDEASRLLATDEADGTAADFYAEAARRLGAASTPDYPDLIRKLGSLGDDWARRAADVCVRDALNRHLLQDALDLATAGPELGAPTPSPSLMLETVEALLLVRDEEGRLLVPVDRISPAIATALRHLADNPHDARVRVRLFRTLSAPMSGDIGRALIVQAVTRLAAGTRIGPPARPRKTVPAEWLEEHQDVLHACIRWLGSEAPVVAGRVRMPAEVLTEPPDDVLAGLARLIQHEATRLNPDDWQHLIMLASLASAVAPHSSAPDDDVRLTRIAAESLATAGHGQVARDLVEGLLESASTPGRACAAWFAMADVYARAGDPIEALLALGCALSVDEVLDQERAWLEETLLVRLLRDSGFPQWALSLVELMEATFAGTEVLAHNGHRLDLMRAQLMHALLGGDEPEPDALPMLLEAAVRAGQGASDSGDDPLPAAATLGQALRAADIGGLPISPAATSLFDGLLHTATPATAELIRTFAAPHPSATDVLRLLNGSPASRYAEDVGFDLRRTSMVARRLLASPEAEADPEVGAFAIELLSDLSVAAPGWEVDPAPPLLTRTIGELGETARLLSRSGASVVMTGMRFDGRLLQVHAREGRLVMAPEAGGRGFDHERLREWALRFPYGYGSDGDPNVFFTSTEEFTFPDLPGGPLVFVTDAGLQRFPPQLLRIGDRFAGWDHPMAVAPSLSWLRAARAATVRRSSRSAAWIPTAEGPHGDRTLAVMADWLRDDFERCGVELDTDAAVPGLLKGVDLAIVGAHGSIVPEGSYFQQITDDALLRLPAARLARGLGNAGVVVLFVCSGGRADLHPSANTVIGLAKQLLDSGCSAVVGSPWPLDPRLTIRWLPEFLRRWTCGERLFEAVFYANGRVDKAWPYDPARSLALGIYGDPFVTKGAGVE